MKYELYYDDGGHGGPYESLEIAWQTARSIIEGGRHTHAIEIRPRSSLFLGGYKDKRSGSYYLYRESLNCLFAI